MNVSDIKKELQNLGLSTATPGLVGDERFEELKYRLEQAQGVLQEQGLTGNEGKSIKAANAATSLSGKAADHGLGQLTIGELRSRLTALGLSTVTPGQTGEERCNTLMQRLVEAICGTSPCEEEEQKPEVKRPAPVQRRAPPVSVLCILIMFILLICIVFTNKIDRYATTR